MATSILYPDSMLPLRGTIIMPGSKSISNRLLIIKALCKEEFDLDHLAPSTDTLILLEILNTFEHTASLQTFDVGDAGTSFRFLTAFFASTDGVDIILKGTSRMHQRPILYLVEALQSLGADISYIQEEGFPPLRIKGKKMLGGAIQMNGDVSSQYISAMCLIAPTLEHGLKIELSGNLVSAPYVEMTLRLMTQFGIEVDTRIPTIEIKPQAYVACDYYVEGDWSSVCFFYAMAMMLPTAHIHCKGLQLQSLQGDASIQNLAADFGVTTKSVEEGILIEKTVLARQTYNPTYDLSDYPDLAIPILVACGIKFPQVKFTGLQHLIYKESNRIQALQNELQKVGIQLIHHAGVVSFEHTKSIGESETIYFKTYSDHRMAMALSLFALLGYTVILDDATCVQKSFPNYFVQLEHLGFKTHEI